VIDRSGGLDLAIAAQLRPDWEFATGTPRAMSKRAGSTPIASTKSRFVPR
jgi:hypothetical protein